MEWFKINGEKSERSNNLEMEFNKCMQGKKEGEGNFDDVYVHALNNL